jgi:hypothetical protein
MSVPVTAGSGSLLAKWGALGTSHGPTWGLRRRVVGSGQVFGQHVRSGKLKNWKSEKLTARSLTPDTPEILPVCPAKWNRGGGECPECARDRTFRACPYKHMLNGRERPNPAIQLRQVNVRFGDLQEACLRLGKLQTTNELHSQNDIHIREFTADGGR